MDKEYSVEVEKEQIKFGEFISICKGTCKYKNAPFTFDKEKFIKGRGKYVRYYGDTSKDPVSHVHVEEPYKYIDYKKMKDGTKLFECYSFEFNRGDTKVGNGYFKIYRRNS